MDFKKAFLVREVIAALEEVAGVSFTVFCLEAGRGTSGKNLLSKEKLPLNLRVFSHSVILDLSMQVLKLLLLQYITAFLLGDHINEEFPTSLPFPGKMLSVGGKLHNKIGLSKGYLLSEIFLGANRFKSI